MRRISRRTAVKMLGGAVSAAGLSRVMGGASALAQTTRPGAAAQAPGSDPSRVLAAGPFKPAWDSLKQYKAPDWFRDAKFGLWNHWTAQCVPEQGDWYARQMYIQGHPQYNYHVKTYGHPSKFGFMEINNLWKAEAWEPEALMDLYVKAGAKYFVSAANHHDNFDNYDSSHHAWNSVNVGPRKDILGIWAKIARAHGLRFGVTNHSGHSWHWFQTAYDYDPQGPQAGVRYDAYTLTKADGKGKWWEGLDPQELYAGRNMVMPDGITTIAAANRWHEQNDRKWDENPPANNPDFTNTWFLRCQEVIDKYKPDLLYFDDTELPQGQAGLDIAAHFYNSSIRDKGLLDVVLNSKVLLPEHAGTMVLDIERGRSNDILPYAWQTDTCIGDWHYKRSIFDTHTYKTAATVITSLADIISKNGNLLLNIPLPGNGKPDSDELKFLGELTSWIPVHGEAIYGTRPFSIYGEGSANVQGSSNFNENQSRPFTAEDIRFTTKGDTLYAFVLAWPTNGKVVIKTLAAGSARFPREVATVELLGAKDAVRFTRDASGLTVNMPDKKPNDYAYVLKIVPR
jgi:alpha-L-fucosidase